MSGQSEFGPHSSALTLDLGAALLVQAENWRLAYRIALMNASVFLLLALAMFALEPRSLFVILSAPALFFLGGVLSFLLMVRSGGDLAAIAWFVLGSGVYFGMGAVAGGLHVHPHSDYLFADDTLYLIRVNLLNACSVLIVLAVAYPLANMRDVKVSPHNILPANIERILPYIVAVSAIGIGLKYILFPTAESLLLRSFATKIYLIIPSCFLLLGLLWHSTSWPLKLIGSSLFALEVLNGLIGLTKYQVISVALAFAIGMWLTRRSTKFVLISCLVVGCVFAVINPLITLGRAHIDYDPNKNTVAARFAILSDAINAYYLDEDSDKSHQKYSDKFQRDYSDKSQRDYSDKSQRDYSDKFTYDIKKMSGTEARLRALGRRFDVASIQGYLINEYNSERLGRSLTDFWAVFIPRALWPEKPIVTRFGVELNAQYYYVPGESIQNTSATAPTYSAEAYWNYGPPGVVVVSILLGLAAGWLTRCWQHAMAGRDPGFFLIAFPVAIWVSFVESWVVATYLGEFIIFVVLLLAARTAFALVRSLRGKGIHDVYI